MSFSKRCPQRGPAQSGIRDTCKMGGLELSLASRCLTASLSHELLCNSTLCAFGAQSGDVFGRSGGKKPNKNPRRLPRALFVFTQQFRTLYLLTIDIQKSA